MNTTAAAGVGCRPPFTAAQWQELEHQALIFKYLMAGMPVPQELLLPIRRSFDAMAARFYQHPALSYYTHYGKKLDPEPGRCRRTDGKKWRCSKDAYPDSKYCERHMHRGRNRSRKPVETQTISQSQPQSSSTVPVTSLVPASAAGSFQSLPMASIASSSQMHIDPASFAMGSKDFRYLHGMKPEVDEHSFFSEASGSSRGLGVDSSMNNSWRLMPSNMPSYALREGSVVQSSYPQLQSLQDYEQVTISSVPKHQHQHQHQHSFFGSDFVSMEPAKNETRSLRPFFDEWPKTRDSWSDLEEERSNRSAFSTTQLSMSTPMSSLDFDISNRSPSDE